MVGLVAAVIFRYFDLERHEGKFVLAVIAIGIAVPVVLVRKLRS